MREHIRLRYPVLAAAAVVVCSPTPAAGQFGARVPAPPAAPPPRFTLGGDLALAKPKGDLAAYIGNSVGWNFSGLFRIDPHGAIRLRGDAGNVSYGRERRSVRLFGDSRRGEIVTTNKINWGGIGGQWMIPGGPIRPYVSASIGFAQFETTSTLEDTFTGETLGSREESSDFTSAYMFGAGVHVPIGRRSPWAVNVGARYQFGGNARFLQEGGIQENPDGTVTLNTVESKSDLVLYQVGVSLALPSAGGTSR